MLETISLKIGIPKQLFYGYVGLIFFMLGAGIETSWFSAFLVSEGFKIQSVSSIFSYYGLLVAIFSWLTSFLVNQFSVRKIMSVGVLTYLLSSMLLIISINQQNFLLISLSYMLRGASYPMFSYTFLIWITLRTDLRNLGKATSWFWFSFNLGMTILSPLCASFLLDRISPIYILVIGLIMAIIGGGFSLILNRDQLIQEKSKISFLMEVREGGSIFFEEPRLIVGLIVKAINNIGQFGFVIMMPIFLVENQYSLKEWGVIWAMTYVVNIFAGILFGNLGDRYGWRKIVCYFSGTLTAVSCILILVSVYYFPGKSVFLMIGFIVFAFGIAAFGPLSALIPAMLPTKKTAAISVLNLGSGLSNLIGPVLITLLFQKFGGFVVLSIFAILYLLASFLSYFLKLPEEVVE